MHYSFFFNLKMNSSPTSSNFDGTTSKSLKRTNSAKTTTQQQRTSRCLKKGDRVFKILFTWVMPCLFAIVSIFSCLFACYCRKTPRARWMGCDHARPEAIPIYPGAKDDNLYLLHDCNLLPLIFLLAWKSNTVVWNIVKKD